MNARLWILLYVLLYIITMSLEHWLGEDIVHEWPTNFKQVMWYLYIMLIVKTLGFWFIFLVYYLTPDPIHRRIFNVHTQ